MVLYGFRHLVAERRYDWSFWIVQFDLEASVCGLFEDSGSVPFPDSRKDPKRRNPNSGL